MKTIAAILCAAFVFGAFACSKKVVELKSYPLDSIEGIIVQPGLEIDRETTTDGKGSLKITALEPVTIRLFETGPVDVDKAALIYQARVRSEALTAPAYLEMWCHFPGKGEFFSRGLNQTVTGTEYWKTLETPFFLQAGEKPDNVRLNLVIGGKGTVWVDDVKLMKGPL